MGIIAKIRAYLHNVDTIISDFDLMVARLEKAVTHHRDVAAVATKEANRQDAIANNAESEAIRASNVAAKVKDLIS